MRVAIDAGPSAIAGGDRGLGRYARAWRAGWDAADTVTAVKEIKVGHARAHPSPVIQSIERTIRVSRSDCDLFHATSPLALPFHKSMIWICSVQDVIALDDKRYRRSGVKNSVALRWACRSEAIVVNSAYTRERVISLTSYTKPIHVIPLPVSEIFHAAATENLAYCDFPYVVAMADTRTPDPRKRNGWLTYFEDALGKVGLGLKVVGPTEPSLLAISSWNILGRLTDRSLAQLLRGAIGFLYLSQYEGQGLPPLEAMATGTPVVAFRNTSIAAAVGVNDFLVDEPNLSDDVSPPRKLIQEIVERFLTFAADPRRYRVLALKQAQRFSVKTFNSRVSMLANEFGR